MRPIDGIHHITLITGDAPANVDFYVRVLGLRLVKKTVNQDDPSVYHLYYADELGSPGADITFFEYPGAKRGSAGAGMVAKIVHRVGSSEALDFWQERLTAEGAPTQRTVERLAFEDPEGMRHELGVFNRADAPLIAGSSEVPADHALQGFEGVVALVAEPSRSETLLRETLRFAELGRDAAAELHGLGIQDIDAEAGDDLHAFEARGEHRGGRIGFQRCAQRGVPGAGTVHHIAWASYSSEMEQWRSEVTGAGMRPTPVIDRFYFESVYFREPSGILYELATYDGAGFAVDEPLDSLGQTLALPPSFEPMRSKVEPLLTPLPDVTQWRPR